MNSKIEKLVSEREKYAEKVSNAKSNIRKWEPHIAELDKKIKALKNEECLNFLSRNSIDYEKLVAVFGGEEPEKADETTGGVNEIADNLFSGFDDYEQ